MKKLLTPAVTAALVVASLFLLTRNCGLATAYKDMRNSYNELKLITDADKKLSLAHIEQLNNAIVSADETIVQLQGVIRAKSVQVSGLSRELADLRAAEPSQPELESQPLVISLRGQVSKLTEMFTLSQQTIADKDKIIFELGIPELVGIVDGKKVFKYPVDSVTWALNEQSRGWEKNYSGEHALRLSCENLLAISEKRGIVFKIFGLNIDLVKDVLVPSGTFAFGYFCGKRR